MDKTKIMSIVSAVIDADCNPVSNELAVDTAINECATGLDLANELSMKDIETCRKLINIIYDER